jgi:DNA repair protein RadC
MAISDWPLDRRPRERLLAEGPEALLDAELLAVLLRTGVQGKDAIELGRELLVRFGSITGLLSAGLELLNVKGLGQAKAAQFSAAMELARRAMREEIAARAGLTSPGNVRDYLRLALGHRPYEVFVCIWLDAQHKVIAAEEAFKGTLTQTSVYTR